MSLLVRHGEATDSHDPAAGELERSPPPLRRDNMGFWLLVCALAPVIGWGIWAMVVR